jgi:hypothetical protein
VVPAIRVRCDARFDLFVGVGIGLSQPGGQRGELDPGALERDAVAEPAEHD